jgi:AcrR family transcriptional regulator
VSDTAPRKPDAEKTRQNILAVARQEFAEHGLSGARVDAIAARISTTKRMIYYYFGSKEGLYLAVLEQVYGGIRALEQTLDLDRLSPVEALRQMIDFTFDYHEQNPDFVRLVSVENIHHGAHLKQSATLRNLNSTVIASLATILDRGRAAGLFHADIDPVDLHMMISAPCYYRVSNRHTFGTLFARDLGRPDIRERHKRMITDSIVGYLTTGCASVGA